MNRYVADADWGVWIIWYFFLGGIAAGSMVVASLAGLFGDESDRRAARAGDYIALPLVMICGVFLIIDLGNPPRTVLAHDGEVADLVADAQMVVADVRSGHGDSPHSAQSLRSGSSGSRSKTSGSIWDAMVRMQVMRLRRVDQGRKGLLRP